MSEDSKFIMPAEWETQSGVWLAWPHDELTFPGPRLELVKKTYIEIIKNLIEEEKIFLLVLNEAMRAEVLNMLNARNIESANLEIFIITYADVWMRDYGPMFVRDSAGKLSWVKWQYDAYSKKFPTLVADNEVFKNLKSEIDHSMLEAPMVLEGGSIEQNGEGIIITTEQCLLNSDRNPNQNREQIENYLNEFLGAKKIIWLKQGITNDHTDGHVDDIAKFVAPNKVLCCYEDDKSDENYEILKENFKILENSGLEVIKLPMPHMKYDDGSKAPVSYANFFIGNNVVLVPTYRDKNDLVAIEIIKSHFPNRKVVDIDCVDLIYGGGSIHCITQQQPK